MLGHHLVVGIAQLHRDALALDGHVVQCRLFLPHDGRDVHRLAWAVDAAVGKHAGMLRMIFPAVVGVSPVGIHRGIIGVALGRGKQLRRHAVVKLANHLALLVAGPLFRIRGLFPSGAIRQAQGGVGDGLSRCGVHHHIAHLVLRHGLRQHPHTRHKV